jgi:hypothetical protein
LVPANAAARARVVGVYCGIHSLWRSWGLLGLLELEADDPRSQNLSNFLIKFINTNPGTAHLISDGWAVSLIPPVLVLGREGNAQLARRLLENVIRWVADRYGSDSRELPGPRQAPLFVGLCCKNNSVGEAEPTANLCGRLCSF